MMFGAIRDLLSSMVSADDHDSQTASVRDAIRLEVDTLLSDAGRRAPARDMIMEMIGSTAVNGSQTRQRTANFFDTPRRHLHLITSRPDDELTHWLGTFARLAEQTV